MSRVIVPLWTFLFLLPMIGKNVLLLNTLRLKCFTSQYSNSSKYQRKSELKVKLEIIERIGSDIANIFKEIAKIKTLACVNSSILSETYMKKS